MTAPSRRPTNDEPRLTITEVAIRLKKRYSKARDLVFTGRLGDVQKDGRTITVPLSGVEAYERAHQQRSDP